GREPQMVGLLLLPLQPALLAIDAKAQAVLVARRNLACPQHAARTAPEAHHHLDIVVETPAFHERGELGGQFLKLETRDETGEIVGMGADIADTAAGPRALRI